MWNSCFIMTLDWLTKFRAILRISWENEPCLRAYIVRHLTSSEQQYWDANQGFAFGYMRTSTPCGVMVVEVRRDTSGTIRGNRDTSIFDRAERIYIPLLLLALVSAAGRSRSTRCPSSSAAMIHNDGPRSVVIHPRSAMMEARMYPQAVHR